MPRPEALVPVPAVDIKLVFPEALRVRVRPVQVFEIIPLVLALSQLFFLVSLEVLLILVVIKFLVLFRDPLDVFLALVIPPVDRDVVRKVEPRPGLGVVHAVHERLRVLAVVQSFLLLDLRALRALSLALSPPLARPGGVVLVPSPGEEAPEPRWPLVWGDAAVGGV